MGTHCCLPIKNIEIATNHNKSAAVHAWTAWTAADFHAWTAADFIVIRLAEVHAWTAADFIVISCNLNVFCGEAAMSS